MTKRIFVATLLWTSRRSWWWLQIERVCSSSKFPVPVAFPIGGWISAERYQGGLKDEFPQRWSTTAGHILYLSPGRIWICQLPPRKFSVWSSPSTRGRIIINFNLLIISCQQFENNLIVGFVPLPPLQNIAKNILHKIRNTREAPAAAAAAVIVQLRNSSIHPSVHLTSGVLIFVQRISLFPGVNRCSVITLPTVCSYHRIHIFSISWWINCLKEASLTQRQLVVVGAVVHHLASQSDSELDNMNYGERKGVQISSVVHLVVGLQANGAVPFNLSLFKPTSFSQQLRGLINLYVRMYSSHSVIIYLHHRHQPSSLLSVESKGFLNHPRSAPHKP